MNCIWIIVLLFCVGNQGRGTSECGCQIEPRDNCNRGCSCGRRTEGRENCDREVSRRDREDGRGSCDRDCLGNDRREGRENNDRDCTRPFQEERQERWTDGRVDDNRRRSAFDDWEDNTCPCRRELDYYQAEIKDVEEKSER